MKQNIEHLIHDPNNLLLSVQDLVEIIVFKFIKTGSISSSEFQDTKQHVNEVLLKRLPTILEKYQGKAMLRTYLSTVILNICRELIRSKKHFQSVSYENLRLNDSQQNGLYELVIKDESIRLQKIISLYQKQKWKIILLLKLKFRIPVEVKDFKEYLPTISIKDFEEFKREIDDYEECTDLKIYTSITRVINRIEQKTNTPDALRKWTKLKQMELVDLLNGRPPSYNYNEETLQILFEKSFRKEHSSIQV